MKGAHPIPNLALCAETHWQRNGLILRFKWWWGIKKSGYVGFELGHGISLIWIVHFITPLGPWPFFVSAVGTGFPKSEPRPGPVIKSWFNKAMPAVLVVPPIQSSLGFQKASLPAYWSCLNLLNSTSAPLSWGIGEPIIDSRAYAKSPTLMMHFVWFIPLIVPLRAFKPFS